MTTKPTTDNQPAAPPKTLSLQEVAVILGVSPKLVLRFTHRTIKAEQLPCIHVGGEMRFDAEQFQAWKKTNWDEEAFPMLKDVPQTPETLRQRAHERRVERLKNEGPFEEWQLDKDGNL